MKEIEIFFRKLLLKFLIIIFRKKTCRTLPSFKNIKQIKILVIRLNKIGDALITTPLLSILKQNIDCKITVLADKKNHFIFSNNSNIDEILVYKKGFSSFIKTIKQLNKLNLDVTIDAHDDVSTTASMIILFSKAKYLFGLKKWNNSIYTHTVKRLDSTKYHIVDRIKELYRLFNIQIKDNKYGISYTCSKKSINYASTFLRNNFKNKKSLIGVNISAGSIARSWSNEKYKSIVDCLLDYSPNILILCSPQDLKNAKEISDKKIPIYCTPFDEMAAMVEKLDLLFSPDTSVIHIASAFKTPVFGIYINYNTKDMIWSPYKTKFEGIITEDPNFNNLTVEIVIKKLKPFLKHILKIK